MDGGAWGATVHGVAQNWTQLSCPAMPSLLGCWLATLAQASLGYGV